MPKVTFKTSRGRTVTFNARSKPGGARKKTEDTRFASKELTKLSRRGVTGPKAMKAVGKAWRAKK
jgi:hypothetical protein